MIGYGCEISVSLKRCRGPGAGHRWAILVMALALSVFTGLDASSAQARASIGECGDLPNRLAYNITTRKAACWKAREVIRRWGNSVAREGGDGYVGAYYCNYKSTGYESGDICCTASRGRFVHWQTGV